MKESLSQGQKEQNWSESIALPQTQFSMKANLTKKEPQIIDYWKNEAIYKRILNKRSNSPSFTLHDGPPYANGNFHVGHSLNKILKDIINKYQILQGKKVRYVPGWDCHGLPIELAVIKKLANKKKGHEKDSTKVRAACRKYAADFIKVQAQDQTRFGVFWDNSDIEQLDEKCHIDSINFYYTMSPHYEASILKSFKNIYEKGLIYKGLRPIHWCPSCATALAEAEVEYEEHRSPSTYISFPITKGLDIENASIAIWTTTPWTIPANLAVCFNETFTYALYETSRGCILIAEGMEEAFFKETSLDFKKISTLSLDKIKQLQVKHPFLDRESKVIFGDHVTLEAGTGIVHTAPGHGHDDYIVGKQYGLEPYAPVDNRGRYTEDVPFLHKERVLSSNDKIIEILKEKDRLIFSSEFDHSYPHCWRCKKPLIFRSTPQWFLDVRPLKKKALEKIAEVEWVPSWGENRFSLMVENRPDWCLSRQRSWGVPIPAFQCQKCNESFLTKESLDKLISLVEKEGIEIWYSKNATELLPEGSSCRKCGSQDFEKESDILDVWFDSGISWYAALKGISDLDLPADIYLEGSDQHRGWFQSSLWPSIALEDRLPYKKVITHGYVLDSKGKAMSKSLGNVISPVKDIIPKYGADILRLWVSSEEFRTDNTIGFEILNQISDSYRKLRNTFRYILGNLQDLKSEISEEITEEIDLWVLHKLFELGTKVENSYNKYEFHIIYQSYCTVLYYCIIK